MKKGMHLKKMISLLIALCMALTLAACGTGNQANASQSGKQSASAYLDQADSAPMMVTVDLTGGWSVEFARGAVYLYDGEITENRSAAAMLVTLDREVYEERLAEAMADINHKEADGGVYFSHLENESAFVAALQDTAFYFISAENTDDMEAVVARFTLALDR